MTTAEKERIEKEAISYVIQETGYQVLPEHDHWKMACIAGATSENERAQQELQAYREKLKNAIREDFRMCLQKSAGLRQVMPLDDIIKLIDTVTPT